jgi:Tol biopolymer transport system component
MRQLISDVPKIVMCLGILCLAGCFSIERISGMPLASTLTAIPTPPEKAIPTLSPLRGKIAFISGDMLDHHLQLMNANGSQLIDITPPGLREIRFLSWSPDGQYIAFSAWKDDNWRIFTIKSDGSNLAQLTYGKVWGNNPSWSPDGESIMFASSNPNILDESGKPVTQIYRMKPDGTDVHRFVIQAKPDNINMTGSYRKDGFIAVYEPIARYAFKNYVVNPEGEIQNKFPELIMSPMIAWSPDGKFVAYSPDPRISDCLGIEIMKFDKSEPKCLLNKQPDSIVYFSGISWSPDGKFILFSSNLDGDWDLYAINLNGGETFQLTNLPGDESNPSWFAKQ